MEIKILKSTINDQKYIKRLAENVQKALQISKQFKIKHTNQHYNFIYFP